MTLTCFWPFNPTQPLTCNMSSHKFYDELQDIQASKHYHMQPNINKDNLQAIEHHLNTILKA